MNSNPAKKTNVFFNRNFRLIFLGALVSELGALLYSFAVGFYILQISNNNAFLQGLYLALNGIALLVFTPVGGVLGDRFNKAKIMYICDFLKGGVIILATALMLLFPAANAHIVILFVLGILGNIISGIFTPAAGAMLPHILEEQKLQQANAYFSIKNSLEGIVGVILAGILYAALPIHTLFFMVGAAYLASGISETLIRYEHTPSAGQLTLRVAFRDMRDGLDYLKGRKAVLALLGTMLFINFFFAPVGSNFIPYFVRTDLAGAGSYLLDRVLTPELWSSVNHSRLPVRHCSTHDFCHTDLLAVRGPRQRHEPVPVCLQYGQPDHRPDDCLDQYSCHHNYDAYCGPGQAEQGQQHHKHWLSGYDPDRLCAGRRDPAGLRFHCPAVPVHPRFRRNRASDPEEQNGEGNLRTILKSDSE